MVMDAKICWKRMVGGATAAASSDDKYWKFHPVKFGGRGGTQMFAFDVDGDGDNDVVTSINAHGMVSRGSKMLASKVRKFSSTSS